MNYWVYENSVHKKCRIHEAECAFCNDGRGIHGGGETSSGKWSGPYVIVEAAVEYANSRGLADVRGCGVCAGEAAPRALRSDRTALVAVRATAIDAAPWPWDLPRDTKCSLQLKWLPIGRVTLDAKGKLTFPKIAPSPGLYRVRTPKLGGRMAVYVGESENLQRRFGNYRQASEGQATSHRINGWLKDLLANGKEISISAITDTAWMINEGDRVGADLSKKAVRRLFEQFAIVVEHAEDIESLNR